MVRISSDHPECLDCPLNYRTRVLGEGQKSGKIVFLGEAPGRDEDEQGSPFVGKSGRYLNQVLADTGINRYRNWVTNVIYCRPPENDFNHPEAIEARKRCVPRLFNDLKILQSQGYQVIVGLGMNAISPFFTERKSMAALRGNPVNLECGMRLLPTYHPSFIARNMSLENRIGNNLWKLWEEDFLTAHLLSCEKET